MKYLLIFFFLYSCSSHNLQKIDRVAHLQIQKIANDIFVASDMDFFHSNVLVAKLDTTVLIASSPFENQGSEKLIQWIKSELKPEKIIAINTHYHRDGIGGNFIFHENNVETWANEKTIALTKKEIKKPINETLKFFKDKSQKHKLKNSKLQLAKKKFSTAKKKTFSFSNEEVEVFFPGHAHSPDNVVVFLKKNRILFGGCMIKPHKGLGYLGAANVKSWEQAIKSLRHYNPMIVVPGHGKIGDKSYIEKTLKNVESYLAKHKLN